MIRKHHTLGTVLDTHTPSPNVYTARTTATYDELSDADKAEWAKVFAEARRAVAALPQALKLGGEAKPFDLEYKLDVGISEPAVMRPAGRIGSEEHARNLLGLYEQLQRQEGRGFAMHDVDRKIAGLVWSNELRGKVARSDAEARRKQEHRVVLDVSMWDD